MNPVQLSTQSKKAPSLGIKIILAPLVKISPLVHLSAKLIPEVNLKKRKKGTFVIYFGTNFRWNLTLRRLGVNLHLPLPCGFLKFIF